MAGRTTGNSATTIGNSRTAESDTAIAISRNAAPVPSVEIKMICAGAAQITIVEALSHHAVKPKSWASAPSPI
jgi:hypothetical protein